ncbi:MAG: TlpA family protein disulfide reductase [Planctomycetaceae bacterium]|nr:TlpA family protein disulfide reductase [Planctomycetaceae bacterium]
MLRSFRWCATLLLFVVGCQGAPEQASHPPAVKVRLASWDDTEKLIASHRGKVVVLDAWSTWCSPCVAEFPGLVKLHRAHPGQVACISLNCNFTGAADESPDAERPKIEAFLVKQRAEFDNLICTEPDHKLFEALGAAAIPVVRVYDRSGQLRQQFDNDDNEFGDEGFSYEKNITPLVAQLLRE